MTFSPISPIGLSLASLSLLAPLGKPLAVADIPTVYRVPIAPTDVVAGTDTVKSLDPDELLARGNALLRRDHKEQLTPVICMEFGGVTADFVRNEFLCGPNVVRLTAKEVKLLRFLINHHGQVLSGKQILKQVWEEQPFITPHTVDVHVACLR